VFRNRPIGALRAHLFRDADVMAVGTDSAGRALERVPALCTRIQYGMDDVYSYGPFDPVAADDPAALAPLLDPDADAERLPVEEQPPLTAIIGVGGAVAERLHAHRLKTPGAVADASVGELTAVHGIGPETARLLRSSAANIASAASDDDTDLCRMCLNVWQQMHVGEVDPAEVEPADVLVPDDD